MKVLNKNNVKCKCGALLEYDNTDVSDNFIICPCCGNEIEVRKELKFPFDYYDFKNGSNISNQQIDNLVTKGIKTLRKNPSEDYYYIGIGNTIIFVFRNDDDEEFKVFVCKGYYEGYVKY